MITVREVSKRYATRARTVTALKPISLDVREGEMLCIVGDSGSGKSSLLAIMSLLMRPDTGDVFLDDQRCTELSESSRDRARQRYVGLIPQAPRLFPELKAWQNVATGGPTASESRARELLYEVGLATRVEHRAMDLSGGEQQRVSLARALIHAPRVIAADEPSSALDAKNAALIGELLRSRAGSGAAVVVATHDQRLLPFATRVVQLEGGEQQS